MCAVGEKEADKKRWTPPNLGKMRMIFSDCNLLSATDRETVGVTETNNSNIANATNYAYRRSCAFPASGSLSRSIEGRWTLGKPQPIFGTPLIRIVQTRTSFVYLFPPPRSRLGRKQLTCNDLCLFGRIVG